MQRYQQKPVMAVQWFPGVEVAGVESVGFDKFYLRCGPGEEPASTRGYKVGVAEDLWLGPGDWLVTGNNGVDFVLSDEEFKEQYDPVDSARPV
jgi:sarcosine oxidase gamma subunit